jgi:hypothetical protein
MKFPHYISKAKAGNNDSKVNREEALSFIRTEFRDCVDDTMFSFDEQVDIDMQNKLLACWEALSAPMHDRLNFMDKYSSFAYAAEMSRAVDIWSEVAVLVTLLSEALSLHKKLEVSFLELSKRLISLCYVLPFDPIGQSNDFPYSCNEFGQATYPQNSSTTSSICAMFGPANHLIR